MVLKIYLPCDCKLLHIIVHLFVILKLFALLNLVIIWQPFIESEFK